MRFLSSRTFRSLRSSDYRVWAAGALVSNVGTWMQRTAQDWLVLTDLTDRNATAVGIVMALQFGPQVLLLPLTGYAADRFDRRRILMATQAAMGCLALGLGLLIVTGLVQLPYVYAFALLLGCVSAFDSPARQVFVSEVVGEADLSNAVALNSASFNLGRTVGPAVAGLAIAAFGTGPVFLINAVSYLAPLAALWRLGIAERSRTRPVRVVRGNLVDGFRYVRGRPDLVAVLSMLFLFGTFGLNFPIFISTMSVSVFGVGSGEFGVLTSCMAMGSVLGALLAADREAPMLSTLLAGATLFGIGCALAAVMPNYWLFGLMLTICGGAAQTFTTATNGLVQASTEPAMRGRVMAIYLALAFGGTPLGAPIVGWVADHFGPRWGLAVGALAGLSALAVGLWAWTRQPRWRAARRPA